MHNKFDMMKNLSPLQQSIPSNELPAYEGSLRTVEAFGNHTPQKARQDRPQLPQNDIQSQVQKLKKPPPNIQRQSSLPTQQHEFTKVANNPGSTYRDISNPSPAYDGSLRARRSSDSNFQKESRQAIVGEIER